MIRNQYPLAEYQADRDAEAAQTSAYTALADAALISGELTLLEAFELAQAAGFVLAQHRHTGRLAIVPAYFGDWHRPTLAIRTRAPNDPALEAACA